MTRITPVILIAYVVLILISLFLDPKRKKTTSKGARSMAHMILFSTFKMVVVIGIVLVGAAFYRISLFQVTGLSSFSMNWDALGFGITAAFGFVMIYLLWQWAGSHLFTKKPRTEEAGSDIIDALPKRLLQLIVIFVIISLEASVLEEIFFRGIMQFDFSHYVTPLAAGIISGVLFGIAHFYQGASGVAGTSILGIWLGIAYAVTGNLFVPVVGHFFGDFGCMILGARHIIRPESRK